MNNVDFNSRKCLDDDSAQAMLLGAVEIEPRVKVDCESKFCYLGDTLGSDGGVEEAAKACVKYARAKFQGVISDFDRSLCIALCQREDLQSLCSQSVLTFGIETWAMKTDMDV